MMRVRSPGYPSVPLSEAIAFAKKIHERNRQQPVSREVAAHDIGYSGLTGSADRALSALMHFGLAEKAAKGMIRISDLAVKIIHSNDPAERRPALAESAFSPLLFREIYERFSNEPPSPSTLKSYLSRASFASAAIGPASRAYLETYYYVQREGANNPSAQNNDDRDDLALISSNHDVWPAQTQVEDLDPKTADMQEHLLQTLSENLMLKWNIRGSTGWIEAPTNLEGISQVEAHLKALRVLLNPESSIS